ncbi:guanine nucleotide-binding protein subunit alpha-11-like [Megalops cyprinoides]|uniref:guanine nucleotide-binding protein subunit alpha-11-like n=1 Tax=Megalops cyprinoides TaxID=118141 RepID=UPI0018645C5D|nr:guanine nucleotide-binding protein subunit alpha-11-like [Megalops cyprinoides]
MGDCFTWCYRTCTCCLSEEERKAIEVDKQIQVILNDLKRRERSEIKVLLLGTGESGKTTFIKQMRIIHGKGYDEKERRAFARLVFHNIFTAIKSLTVAMTTLKIPYARPENQLYAQWVQDVDPWQVNELEPRYVDAIRHLWADGGVRVCYGRRREFQLLDSTEYYMTNLDRIAAPNYIPTHQDVLRVRVPTSGINDYSFEVEKVLLRIVDVGGQRSERRKWIHCFEYVTSLIFLASLSEYDQVLEENESANRMEESKALFYTTIHSPWFSRASVILFLNKTDILADKIHTSDLQAYYPAFTGGKGDADAAMQFIQTMYLQQTVSREEKKSKPVYPHFTCATDTQNIRKVFNDVKNTVLINSLEQYNLY